MQRLAREIIQTKEFWNINLLFQVAACCNNRFTKLSQIVHQNRSYLNRTQTCPSQLEVLFRVDISFIKVWTQLKQ
jgi:hypothetical protein